MILYSTNKLMAKFENKKQDNDDDLTDADIIKRVKKQNIDMLKELSQVKLLLNESQVDKQKYIRKDKELRDNITELKISFEVNHNYTYISYRICNSVLKVESMNTSYSYTIKMKRLVV